MKTIKSLLLTVSVVTLQLSCKQVLHSGISYNGSELMGVDVNSLQNVAGVVDTPSAGKKARELNAYPAELEKQAAPGGLSLAGSNEKGLKLGDRICVSADYGRAGNNGGGNANETAAKCGRLERCDQRDGWYRDLPALAGDLCMRSDCSAKGNAGLDMPGEAEEGVTPENGQVQSNYICDSARGRSTAFNVSEYFRMLGAFAFAVGDVKTSANTASANANKVSSSAASWGLTADLETISEKLQGDEQYSQTKGLAGNTNVTLADETLYTGDVFMTEYKTNGLALNTGLPEAVARVGVDKGGATGRTVILLFEEDGSSVSDVPPAGVPQGEISGSQGTVVQQGNGPTSESGTPNMAENGSNGSGTSAETIDNGISGLDLTASNGGKVNAAPSAKDLGIVKTRQGNTFYLQNSFGSANYGPAGTVKVIIGGK
jgi:hypothetical protein